MPSHSRINLSTHAEIDTSKIFASGTFKNVWSGVYLDGPRKNTPCVSKQFKTGSVLSDYYFREELNIIALTQSIVDDFHDAGVINRDIVLNTPAIWTYEGSGVKSLVEPTIEKFEKFNSNTGWRPKTRDSWVEAMQALSHFSYHNSGRRFLLCDIQGGAYSNGYILSDPIIMSQEQDRGPGDLGPEGIRTFFRRHRCGKFCSRKWLTPSTSGPSAFPKTRGTTMMPTSHLSSRSSRSPLSDRHISHSTRSSRHPRSRLGSSSRSN